MQFDKWIFDRELFLTQLNAELPVKDFFGWCSKMLLKDFSHIETEKFFAITGLLFDEALNVEFPKKDERTTIETLNARIDLPKIKIDNPVKI
jgi:hypothetical protein